MCSRAKIRHLDRAIHPVAARFCFPALAAAELSRFTQSRRPIFAYVLSRATQTDRMRYGHIPGNIRSPSTIRRHRFRYAGVSERPEWCISQQAFASGVSSRQRAGAVKWYPAAKRQASGANDSLWFNRLYP